MAPSIQFNVGSFGAHIDRPNDSIIAGTSIMTTKYLKSYFVLQTCTTACQKGPGLRLYLGLPLFSHLFLPVMDK